LNRTSYCLHNQLCSVQESVFCQIQDKYKYICTMYLLIQFAGWNISEPMTLLTNTLICATGIYHSNKVYNGHRGHVDYIYNFCFFLFFTAISAIWGGIFSHGFKEYFSIAYSIPGWILALLGSFFAVRGALQHAYHQGLRGFDNSNTLKVYHVINILFLAIAIVSINIYPSFTVVAIYTAVTLSLICGYIELSIYKSTGDIGSKWYLLGIGSGMLTLLLFVFKIHVEPYLNTNDLSHIWMIVSLIIFSRSFILMEAKAVES
jgi:hypothetical protein